MPVSITSAKMAWMPDSLSVRCMSGGRAGPGYSMVWAPSMITRPSPYSTKAGVRVAMYCTVT